MESGASPHIQGNWIHSGRTSGVVYFEGGMGTLAGNTVRVVAGKRRGCPVLSPPSPLALTSPFSPLLSPLIHSHRHALRPEQLWGNEEAELVVLTMATHSMQVWGNEEAGLQITEGSEPLVTANRFLRQGGRAAVQEPLGQVQERERKEREQRRQQRQRDMTLAPSAALDGSPAIWIHCGGRGTLEGTNPSPSPSPDPNPYPSPDSDPYPNPNPNPNPDQARSRVTRSRPRAGTASWWGRYTYYGYITTMASSPTCLMIFFICLLV